MEYNQLSVANIRECVRQLRSVEIKPTGNPPVYLFPISREAALFHFVWKNFPSWMQYV